MGKTKSFMMISMLLGLVCCTIVGVTFDNYSADKTIINLLITEVFITVFFIIMAIPIQLNSKLFTPLLIICCVTHLIATPVCFVISALRVKEIKTIQCNNAETILKGFEGLNNGEGHYNLSLADCCVRYSFNIDENNIAEIVLTENIEGIVDEIVYSIRSKNFYDGSPSKKVYTNIIQMALNDLDSRLVLKSSMYKFPEMLSYVPIIDKDFVALYETKLVDSKSNVKHYRNLRIFERLENREGENFEYSLTIRA